MPKVRALSATVADQVVFMNIGWNDTYDGTTPLQGSFGYFGTEEAEVEGISEEELFVPVRGKYKGPLGRGKIERKGRLDVVFTAINKKETGSPRRIVALFRDVEPEYNEEAEWWMAGSRDVLLLRGPDRPRLDYWPGHMGLRRWAKGGASTNHLELLRAYEALGSDKKGDRLREGAPPPRGGEVHGQSMLLALGEPRIKQGHYENGQVWRAAERAWVEARATDRTMPVLFGDPTTTSHVLFRWARITDLRVTDTGSRIAWTDVKPIAGHTVAELHKISDGTPVKPGGGRYFVPVETPEFLQRSFPAPAATSPTAREAGREAARSAPTLEDAEHDPLAYEQVQRRLRRHQSAFRTKLLAAYGERCAITGADVPAVLEAAHIDPHSKSGDNRTDNGLLLRADLHALFDMGLLRISPVSHRIDLHPNLRRTEYASLQGQQLRPRSDDGRPDDSALRARWDARLPTAPPQDRPHDRQAHRPRQLARTRSRERDQACPRVPVRRGVPR